MKIRIRFAKRGEMRFVGHLDIMRFFQKALRRAEIPVSYTQGFHPHPIMSFASPLGIGLTSEGEYLDIEVEESGPSEAMCALLNREMAGGMEILGWRRLPDDEKTNAMALVAAALYRAEVLGEARRQIETDSRELWIRRWEEFLDQPEIPLLKKTKKSESIVDIRPLIREAEYDGAVFRLLLSAGSVQNLKPETVLLPFFSGHGLAVPPEELTLCRLDMFAEQGGQLVSLEDLGEVIA